MAKLFCGIETTPSQDRALADWWRRKDEIRDAIKCGFNKLPQHLQDRWFEPDPITGSGWIEEASKYIDIPHKEVWNIDKSEEDIIKTEV